jgi:hypothetical protein
MPLYPFEQQIETTNTTVWLNVESSDPSSNGSTACNDPAILPSSSAHAREPSSITSRTLPTTKAPKQFKEQSKVSQKGVLIQNKSIQEAMKPKPTKATKEFKEQSAAPQGVLIQNYAIQKAMKPKPKQPPKATKKQFKEQTVPPPENNLIQNNAIAIQEVMKPKPTKATKQFKEQTEATQNILIQNNALQKAMERQKSKGMLGSLLW